MNCIRCGVTVVHIRPATHETEYCSDECENGEVTVCAVCCCLVDTDDIVWRGQMPVCTDCEPEGDDCR